MTSGHSFVEIAVNRNKDHNHTSMVSSNQIRGDDRESIAERCIIDSNGSAHAFDKAMVSDYVLAGEEVPEDFELKSKRLKDVVRKCISEHMNQETVIS